jgi:hypothetical protein
VALGDPAATLAFLEAAAVGFRTLEDLPWLSRVLAFLSVFVPTAEQGRAQALAAEALALARVVGEPYTLAYAELLAGAVQRLAGGDLAAARAHTEAALALGQPLEADWLTLTASRELALLLWRAGQWEAPRRLLPAVRAQLEALGDRFDAAQASIYVALLESTHGDAVQAARAWRLALQLAQDMGNTSWPVMSLAAIAGLVTAHGQAELGARLLGAVDRRWSGLGEYAYLSQLVRDVHARSGAATRAALSPEAFAQAWSEGEALSLDQATALALAVLADLGASDRE